MTCASLEQPQLLFFFKLLKVAKYFYLHCDLKSQLFGAEKGVGEVTLQS